MIMEQVGWFVVGEGNFGSYLFGGDDDSFGGDDDSFPMFISIKSSLSDIQYWKNRGYTIIPAYVNATDKEDYSFVEKNDEEN